MKSYFAALAAMLLTGTVAQAQPDTRYFASVLGGVSSHPSLDLGASHPGVDNGFNLGARAGVNLDGALPWSGFSADIDYFYNKGYFKSPASDTHLNSHSIMADLTYHAPVMDRWGLYGGAGLGAVHTNLSGAAHGGSTVLGWQALGGLDYAMDARTTVFAEYRYQNAHNANIPGTGAVGNTSNNFSLGIKYGF